MANETDNTNGGTSVGNDVKINEGDFVGRDKKSIVNIFIDSHSTLIINIAALIIQTALLGMFISGLPRTLPGFLLVFGLFLLCSLLTLGLVWEIPSHKSRLKIITILTILCILGAISVLSAVLIYATVPFDEIQPLMPNVTREYTPPPTSVPTVTPTPSLTLESTITPTITSTLVTLTPTPTPMPSPTPIDTPLSTIQQIHKEMIEHPSGIFIAATTFISGLILFGLFVKKSRRRLYNE